ncbi:MAG: hypothetical protein LBL99_00550 [Holosporaceae bacterium]|jgi:hypothetical protein|nr:hypothetical protein [Holosporaceae bacterium]
MKHKYILRHGFSFTNEYWKNLIPLLEGEVVFYDPYLRRPGEELCPTKDPCVVRVSSSLGSFASLKDDVKGERFAPRDEGRVVGIGHSLGFQELNNSGIEFDFLVCLQGFIDYCGSEPKQRERRAREIDGMIKAFEIDTKKRIQEFHDYCNCDDPLPQSIVAEDLIADLLSMKKSYEYCGRPALAIGSDADDIVPMSIINDNFQRFAPLVKIEQINGVPHSLGFLKAKEVAEKIKEFEESLDA